MYADKTGLNEYVKSLCAEVTDDYRIPSRYFEGDAVKRGLRNADGTGVMAGVTRVGSVQGYYMRDMEKAPIPGELYYRGINVNDIVSNHASLGTFGYEEVAYLLLFGKLSFILGANFALGGNAYVIVACVAEFATTARAAKFCCLCAFRSTT